MALTFANGARADEFQFSFSGGGITSSGVFTTAPSSTPGVEHVTGITGTFSDTNDGISGTITGLYEPVSYQAPAPTVPTGPPAFTSGGLSYDDTFYPNGNSPNNCPDYPFFGGDFDIYGVAFNVSSGYVGEIWSDGNIPGQGLRYGAGDANSDQVLDDPNQGSGVPVAFTASAVPEPGWLGFAGMAVVGALARWRRKSKG